MIAKATVERKVRWIEDTLDRMERGLYVGVGVCEVTDAIAWLWRFRHIVHATMERLTSEAARIITEAKPD